ncbi:MAG: protein translocase subunit SecD, partial [Steroidobacteraceae bacterium]
MYHFAKWKYWLVIIVLVVGTLYALPNLFGEGPALQLSRNDRQAMDETSANRVRTILEGAKIPVEDSYLEKDRLVLRFGTPDQQAKARESITKTAPEDYLLALASAPRMPEWMRRLGLKPMSLGLDLRGGVHFIYEVDIEGAIAQAVERSARDARVTLRDKRIPYTAVTTAGTTVRIVLREGADVQKAIDALKVPDGSIQIVTDETPAGPVIELRATPQEIKRRQDVAVQQNITTLRNRVDELGISEPIITRQAANRISVQLPGVEDPNEAIRVLGATATLEFRLVDENNNPYEAESNKRVPI